MIKQEVKEEESDVTQEAVMKEEPDVKQEPVKKEDPDVEQEDVEMEIPDVEQEAVQVQAAQSTPVGFKHIIFIMIIQSNIRFTETMVFLL